eukprot:c11321_g1_i1 orf=100-735(+)
MAPPDKKSEGGKAPAKVETINLKVFIHCEGCKKKVKKILHQIDGVETVEIDASLGKVTVTGTVDSTALIKKLDKAGKVAELLPGNAKGKEQQKDQAKVENKEVKKVRFEEGEGDKKGKGGGGGGEGGEGGKKGNGSGDNKGSNNGGGAAKNEESGKNKKGGEDAFDEAGPSKTMAHKNITPSMIETSYSVESADYATHIFSDENTNSCHIM